LTGSRFKQSDITFANLRQAQLDRDDFTEADLSDCDLAGASLTNANLTGAKLSRADLRGADLSGVTNSTALADVEKANIHGVRNAPPGFVDWALAHHAVDIESDATWNALLKEGTK
jgi:uncharacterized protein YjbI with pentapeptide repeats